MSKQTTDELLLSIAADYHRLESRKAKHAILEKIMSLTGYKSPKTIIRKLASANSRPVGKSRGRPRICPEKMVEKLKDLWFLMEQPCGKRMKSMLPEWLPHWEKRQECSLTERERNLMLSISAASLDRTLSPFRVKDISAKEKASLSALKNSIPIVDPLVRPDGPGWLFCDTVAHGGNSTEGDFVWSLTLTDAFTQWTIVRAIWNKGQHNTCSALDYIFRELPMRPRQFNTDNGSEFINHHVQRYMAVHHKTCQVTRSRPFMKNDNSRAEQKNRNFVRRVAGYDRLGDERMVRLLNRVYGIYGLLTNHFYPCVRVIASERKGKRLVRHYDQPQTPYVRLMAALKDGRRKERLRQIHERLDPLELRDRLEEALRELHLCRQEWLAGLPL